MALATFTPSNGDQIEIGGIAGSPDIPGPFPRYSISTEILKTDALELGTRYSITVTGTAIINNTASMLVAGARQSEIHKIIGFIALNRGNTGTLLINPYGGVTPITFNDCVLVSCDVPEQDDVSQGVQTQEYTFTFEATRVTVNGRSNDTIYGTDPKDYILEYSESWSCSANEGQYTVTNGADDTPSEPMYTVTHSLSAVGKSRSDGKNSYLQAKAFVNDRLSTLGEDPTGTFQDKALTPSNIDLEFVPNDYNAYNQINSYTNDITAGSYAVERTWVIAKSAATVTVELTSNVDPSAESNTVDLSVTFTGLDSKKGYTKGGIKTKNDKYANALAAYGLSSGNFFTWANNYYNATGISGGSGTLKENTATFSRTDNKSDGVISVSYSYNDLEISTDFPCASSQTVNLSETNALGIQQVVAILPVIAKADGPVIQDMATTPERTRSATLDLQIKKEIDGNPNCRGVKPDGISYLLANYEPQGVSFVYIQSATDSWSPTSGAYSATVDWVWTDDDPSYAYFTP